MSVDGSVKLESLKPGIQIAQVSTATFVIYMIFIVDMLLHVTARIPGIGVIRPTIVLVLILTGLLMSQARITKHRDVSDISAALFAIVIYLIVTLPLVSYPGSVLRANVPVFIKAIVFFYFTMSIIDTPKRLKIFLIVYLSCQIFRVLEPLFLNITQGYWGSSTYMGGGEFASRLAGAPFDVINPNELGFVIVGIVPFIHFLLSPRGWKCKFLYAGLMACLMYALILTMSRGAFIALVVVAWVVFINSERKVLLVFIGVLSLVVAYSVMNPVQKDRYFSLFSSDSKQSKSVDGRFRGIEKEFKLGLNRPIFGHGLGTTPESKFHTFGKRQASHTMYGEILIEIGFIGMYLFYRFIVAIYREIKKAREISRDECIEIQRMNTVLVTIFWMYIVYSINYWGLSQSYWYLLAGLSVSYLRIVRMQKGNDLYSPLITKKKI